MFSWNHGINHCKETNKLCGTFFLGGMHPDFQFQCSECFAEDFTSPRCVCVCVSPQISPYKHICWWLKLTFWLLNSWLWKHGPSKKIINMSTWWFSRSLLNITQQITRGYRHTVRKVTASAVGGVPACQNRDGGAWSGGLDRVRTPKTWRWDEICKRMADLFKDLNKQYVDLSSYSP